MQSSINHRIEYLHGIVYLNKILIINTLGIDDSVDCHCEYHSCRDFNSGTHTVNKTLPQIQG